MEGFAESIKNTCVEALDQLAKGQTPHYKIHQCHEEDWDIPKHLTIKCLICGRPVDTPPNEVLIKICKRNASKAKSNEDLGM